MMPAHPNRKVLIRADGSRRLGLGHIVRCLALAEGLRERGDQPTFVMRDEDPSLIQRVQGAGYPVVEMQAPWGFEHDLTHMARLLSPGGLVVTDLCNADSLGQLPAYQRYLEGLKAAGAYLITIDDLNTLCFPSDVLINPNWGAERLPYQRSPGAAYLLGPKYFLFRRPFREAASQPRRIRREANRVLVSMGGGDTHRALGKVLKALRAVHQRCPLEIRVAMGLQGSTAILQGLAGGFGDRCQLLKGVDSLGELFLWCDVAIIGGGLTKYEAAVTGTPALVLSQVEPQWQSMQGFVEAGSAVHLGRAWEVGEEEIASPVGDLLADEPRRCAMSQAGKQVMDGRGVERVVEAMAQ